MKISEGRGISIFLLIAWLLFSGISAIRVDLYLNKDKFGEFLRLDISEKGCTNVPLNWDNQAISLDTHGSCVKFYDLPYCRGKYVALQAYHGTFQDNLETIQFKQIISSASPCGPKVPSGRYYILNGADGSLLTIDKKNGTVLTKTLPFKPYITKNQQFQIDKISVADYEIIPRVYEDLNPLTFDMSISSKTYPVRRTWKIESVYRGKYLIKNEWNNRCLYKSDVGKVDEHDCVAWSPNQEWMFKAIKIQPFFPSKEQLSKQPAIRPDDQLPFHPQQEVNIFPQYPHLPKLQPGPGEALYVQKQQPKQKKKPEKDSDENSDEDEEEEDDDEINKTPTFNKPHTGHNPIVLNPREPFPPVQSRPIYPKGTIFLPPIGPDGKPDYSKPPVPQVRHPGQPPFPRNPVVHDPKKTSWPAALVGSFGPTPPPTVKPKQKTPNSDEEDEEDENEKDDPEDNERDYPEENEKDDPEGNEKDGPEENEKDDPEGNEKDDAEEADKEDAEEEADDPDGEHEEDEETSREREDSSNEKDEEE